MSTTRQKSRKKIIAITEKDPNYINTFATDAFSENTPNMSTMRITFYEEVAVRPDVEISGLDTDGRIIEGTTENIFNMEVDGNKIKNEDANEDMVIVKRIEKATLTMSKESLLRLRDWLNNMFPQS